MTDSIYEKRRDHEDILYVNHENYRYFNLASLCPRHIIKLPYCIRALLENVLRNYDGFSITGDDINHVMNWTDYNASDHIKVPFRPARILMNETNGLQIITDLVSVKNLIAQKYKDKRVFLKSMCPTTLVIDRSNQPIHTDSSEASEKNEEAEFIENKERYRLIKWATTNIEAFTVIPPGCGTSCQLNLEICSQLLMGIDKGLLYPDSLVGLNSQSACIGALGILGWNVSMEEMSRVMAGDVALINLPQVIGVRIEGRIKPLITPTDVAIWISDQLRGLQIRGYIVEFFGPGLINLTVPCRASIINMCVMNNGTLSGFFPIDSETLKYMERLGRNSTTLNAILRYALANQMFYRTADFPQSGDIDMGAGDTNTVPKYSTIVTVDLENAHVSVVGPETSNQLIPVDQVPFEFGQYLSNQYGIKVTNYPDESQPKFMFVYKGASEELCHGDIVIAAICGSLSTLNPKEMLGVAIMARKAVSYGLQIKPYIKRIFSPGSHSVVSYLNNHNLLQSLAQLGFHITGYSAFTAVYRDAGKLDESLENALNSSSKQSVSKPNVITVGIISGYEEKGQKMASKSDNGLHTHVPATFHTSAQMVLAYALIGNVCADFNVNPVGTNASGQNVYLRDIWPTNKEIERIEANLVNSSAYQAVPQVIKQIEKDSRWGSLKPLDTSLDPLDKINNFHDIIPLPELVLPNGTFQNIINARVFLQLGDNVSADDILSCGRKSKVNPSGEYLHSTKFSINNTDFCETSFTNSKVFNCSNYHLSNSITETINLPSEKELLKYSASQKYKTDGMPLILLIGANFGSYSSNFNLEMSARSLHLLGVKAVIAESFYDSKTQFSMTNALWQAGILPLQVAELWAFRDLRLTRETVFSIDSIDDLSPRCTVRVSCDGGRMLFNTVCMIDTLREISLFKENGILNRLFNRYHNSMENQISI